MVNINFFGGPGTGKSTTASGLFHEMKKEGFSIEYISEYAKDLVYSKDYFKLKDQLMVLANQSHPWFKLENQVDFTVNDGPFMLGLVYLQENSHMPAKEFKAFLLEMWHSYDHINIFIERDIENHAYQEYGRNQTLAEAIEKDNEIRETLEENGIPYYSVVMGPDTVKESLKIVKSHLS
jgi:hypothetical protein